MADTIRDTISQLGIRRFLAEIPPWLVRRRYLVYSAIPHGVPAPDHGLPPLECSVLTEADSDSLAAFRPSVYTASQVRERLRRGHLAIVGRIDGVIVHARWIFVGSIELPYLERRLVLPSGDGYLDEVYTAPAWRRQRVEFAAAVAMHRRLRELGFQRIFCVIASWNRPPQRVAEALGYTLAGSCGYWNILGHKKFFRDGAVVDAAGGTLRVEAVTARR